MRGGEGGERETRKSEGLTRMVKKWHELFCYLKKIIQAYVNIEK